MAGTTTESSTLVLSAPAKINLFLHVTGRRADGYHTLDSLVAFTEVGDELCATAAHTLSLIVEGPFAAALGDAVGDNLVLRAAGALAAESGIASGAALRLTKALPVASGIGGGSADAAAALLLLRRLWGTVIDDAGLATLGLALGADVPVCLAGRPSRVGGIGEILQPVGALPDCGVLLVNPGVPVSTAEVYRRCRPAGESTTELPPPGGDAAALAVALSRCRNDLEGPALEIAPAIADVLAALRTAGGCRMARLSGSGATCFGLFDAPRDAAAAATAIRAVQADWWVSATRFRAPPPEVLPG